MVWPGRSTPPDRLPSPRILARDCGFSGLVTPVARRERRHVLAHRRNLAGDVAPELHGHRKGAPAVNAAVVSGRLAIEFVHLAAAILDVPARHRGGDDLDQHAARPDVRHRIVAIDQLVRPAELEQSDGLHRGHRMSRTASITGAAAELPKAERLGSGYGLARRGILFTGLIILRRKLDRPPLEQPADRF